jgi:hypothetical protein
MQLKVEEGCRRNQRNPKKVQKNLMEVVPPPPNLMGTNLISPVIKKVITENKAKVAVTLTIALALVMKVMVPKAIILVLRSGTTTDPIL